jgi:Amt family ammonium transporter
LSYVLAEFEAQARGEKLLSADLPCQRKDSSLFYADVNAVMVVLDGRRCNVGFFTDVTERKKAEEALRESEARFRSIFESIQDIFYRTNAQGIILEISPSVQRVGYSREQLIGTNVLDVYEDPEERAALVKAIVERGEVSDFEIRLKTGDGRVIDISVSGHVLRGPDGTFSGTEGTLRDISDRKKAEEKLEIFSNAVEGAYDSFVMVDMNGNVIYANESAIKTFDYSPEEIMKLNVAQFAANPEDAMKVIKEVETKGSYSGELISIGKKKEAIPVLLSISILKDNKGNPTGMMSVFRDITERKRAEEALHEQARRDPLTGVLNHGAIVNEMRGLISTGEDAPPWAVAMIDVDHLKVMNDTYGHQVGDAMLVAVAAALSRDDALVGRYGGDEFVAILPIADRAAAEDYRSKAMDALADATITDPQTGATVRAEASIGLAIYPEDATTLADLIKISDDAMYAVKRQRPVRRPSPRKHAPDRKAA